MGGAAAVIGAVVAIARLGLPVDVTGYVCAGREHAERQRAAAGRRAPHLRRQDRRGAQHRRRGPPRALADALVRAQEDKPDVLIDIATLTGAAVVALGARTAGIMANDDDLREAVHDASKRAGEPTWPMPLPEELRANLDSTGRRHRQHPARRPPRGRHARRRRSSCASSSRTASAGRTSTSPGPAYNAAGAVRLHAQGRHRRSVRTLVQVAEDMANDALRATPHHDHRPVTASPGGASSRDEAP